MLEGRGGVGRAVHGRGGEGEERVERAVLVRGQRVDVDEFELNKPEQFAVIDAIRETTVLLSEMMRNVLFDEGEMNAA